MSIINFTASASSDAIVPETEKLFMEGRIVQKLECRPYGILFMQIKCVEKKIYTYIYVWEIFFAKFFFS